MGTRDRDQFTIAARSCSNGNVRISPTPIGTMLMYHALPLARTARCTMSFVGYTAPRLLSGPLSRLPKDRPTPVHVLSVLPFPTSMDSTLIPAGMVLWSSSRKGRTKVLQIFNRAAGLACSRLERRRLPPRCGTKRKRRIGVCGESCAKRGACRV